MTTEESVSPSTRYNNYVNKIYFITLKNRKFKIWKMLKLF